MNIKEIFPGLEKQFDKKLNKDICLSELTIGSRKKVWWRCEKAKDHIWHASLNQRTSGEKLRGCPICGGKKVVKSNCLSTTNPSISAQWNYEKNKNITPENITAGSNKKVWWKCPNNPSHTWLASPKQRIYQNNKCPICKSLGNSYPNLAKEWHPTKNGNITPLDISANTHQKVWWKCPKGPDHIWLASPNTRVSIKSGCPICSGHKVVKSNSLATTHPEIASQWHYEKNKSLIPEMVHAGSHQKVWWICKRGDDHIWSAIIRSRVKYNLGCPVCSGRKVAKSNSLAVKKPNIAKMWHAKKNDRLTPFNVTPYSNKVVWWKCPKGNDHEWKATVANVVNGSTCPVCMNRKITPSNNLFALYPNFRKEWDFEKNKNVNTLKISAGSKIKVWWICNVNNEHNWQAAIRDRTQKGSGCPFCAIKLNVSELKMLQVIKKIFSKEKILYRRKPKWLQGMEIDVYLPKLRLAFEYQGIQHFKPIEYFGGEEVYIEQVKRDKLKRTLCEKNNISLLYVYYDENLSEKSIQEKLIDSGFIR